MTRPLTTRFHGTLQIVCFNWPFYLTGAAAILLAALALQVIPLPKFVTAVLLGGILLAGYWLLASVAASYCIYDRSPLRTWRWIPRALSFIPARWINLHAGLDESSAALNKFFPECRGRVFDIYDAAEMTEPSIRRARQCAQPAIPAEPVNYRRLPLPDAACDAAMLLLSAHELRRHASRLVLFRELRRVLAPGGGIILAEHLRDLPNFLAFGPGFLHFHSRRAWLRVAREADLRVEAEFRITPFIAVFVLRRIS